MTNNPLLNHVCSHCGCTGQVYITWDNGWETTCYRCSCVDKIPEKEIPPELKNQKYRYSEHVLGIKRA